VLCVFDWIDNNWDEWDGRADEGEDVEDETYDDLHCEHPDFIVSVYT